MHALRAAMQAASECGVGLAFARQSNHFGPISPYGLIAAEAGYASIIGSNATTTIAPGAAPTRASATAPSALPCRIRTARTSCSTWP